MKVQEETDGLRPNGNGLVAEEKSITDILNVVRAVLCSNASFHLEIQRLWISQHAKHTTSILPDSGDKINECQSKNWPHLRRSTQSLEISLHPEV